MTVKIVTMTEGIPLVSKSGLRELILLLQQMRSPIFQIGVLYTCSNDSSTDQYTSNSNAIAISFWCFPRYQPNELKSRTALRSHYQQLTLAFDKWSLNLIEIIANQTTSGPV